MRLHPTLQILAGVAIVQATVSDAEQVAIQPLGSHDSPNVLANCNPRVYAALGDSYSAGLDSSAQLPNCTGIITPNCTQYSCARNYGAYGYRFWREIPSAKFTFSACSGASTSDIQRLQVPTIDTNTELVTLTAGGDNDDIFSDIISSCCYYGYDCDYYINKAKTLIANLDKNVTDLWSAINARAPRATIVHLGYAEFWPRTNYHWGKCQSYWLEVSADTAKKINDVVYLFNAKLASLAYANRSKNVTFFNVDSAFSAHRMCEPNTWFIWDTDFSRQYYGGVFHPNYFGQNAYLTGLRLALGCSTSSTQGHGEEEEAQIEEEL